jgi:hypothetical protein
MSRLGGSRKLESYDWFDRLPDFITQTEILNYEEIEKRYFIEDKEGFQKFKTDIEDWRDVIFELDEPLSKQLAEATFMDRFMGFKVSKPITLTAF